MAHYLLPSSLLKSPPYVNNVRATCPKRIWVCVFSFFCYVFGVHILLNTFSFMNVGSAWSGFLVVFFCIPLCPGFAN